jgi:hypothetical protein
MSFKVDPHSAQRIRANARAARASVSAYLRKMALGEDMGKPVKMVRQKHPVSGLPYNGAGGGRVVTDEEIHTALADYP